MKYFKKLILTVAMLTVVFSASAEPKMATVNMKKLFDGYYKTKMAMTALDKKRSDLLKEAKEMADGLDKARTDYKALLEQASDPAISSDEHDRRRSAATQKGKEISDSQVALEQFQRQAQAQISETGQRMSDNLVADIKKAVADKAKAGSYSMVLNTGSTSSDAVVYASLDNDITDSVLAELNAGAPIDVTKPSDALPLLTPGTNSP
jgi:Skp family chaperone for outer membrane proteins